MFVRPCAGKVQFDITIVMTFPLLDYNIMFVSLADGHTNMCNAFEKRNKVR